MSPQSMGPHQAVTESVMRALAGFAAVSPATQAQRSELNA